MGAWLPRGSHARVEPCGLAWLNAGLSHGQVLFFSGLTCDWWVCKILIYGQT